MKVSHTIKLGHVSPPKTTGVSGVLRPSRTHAITLTGIEADFFDLVALPIEDNWIGDKVLWEGRELRITNIHYKQKRKKKGRIYTIDAKLRETREP